MSRLPPFRFYLIFWFLLIQTNLYICPKQIYIMAALDNTLGPFDRFKEWIELMEEDEDYSVDIDGPSRLSENEVAEAVDEIKESSGYRLSSDFIKYMSFCGTQLNWSRDNKIGGEFCLSQIRDIFSLEDWQQYTDDDSEEDKAIKKQFALLDQHPNAGDDMNVWLRLEGPDKMPPEIWFMERGEIWKMDNSFGEYIEALIDLKGIYNWQFLFIDTDFYYIEKLKKDMDAVEALYPDVDYTKYKKRYAELAKKSSANK